MQEHDDYNTPTESRAWQVALILVFLVTAGLNAYVVASTWDVGWMGASLFTNPHLTRVKIVEPGSEAERAGINPNDQLVSVDDLVLASEDCKERSLTLRERSRYQELMRIGSIRRVTYCRKNPDDSGKPEIQKITTTLQVRPWPLYMRVNYYVSWLIKYLVILIVLWHLGRKTSTLPMRLVCLACIIYSLGGTTEIPAYSKLNNTLLISSTAVMSVVFHAILIWPSPHPLVKKHPLLIHFIYWFFAVFVAGRMITRFILFSPMFLEAVAEAPFLPIKAAIILVVVQQYLGADDLKRQQFRWMALSIVVFMPLMMIMSGYFGGYRLVQKPSALLNSIDIRLYQVYLYLNYAFLLISSVTSVMAFTGYRLDLAQTAVSQSLKYSALYTVVGAVLLGVAGCGAYLAQDYAVIRQPWAVIAITILAVVVVYPAQRRLGQRLDRLLRGKVIDLRDFKDQVDQFILTEIEPGALINQVLARLHAIIECSTAFVFLRGDGGPDWRLAAFIRLSSTDTERLASGPPRELTQYLDEKPEPTSKIKLLSRTRLGIEQGLRTDLVEVIDSIRTDAVVPVISHGCMKGIMCLGPKPKKGVYTAEELTLLGQIASKVGMGLQSALAYESMEREVEKRTRELKEAHSDMERLTESMKYYLSPQLVDALASHKDRKALPESRRAKLTICFSDIKGFTEATDRMQPEELSELLNHYLTEMSQIAVRHGGTIDKYVGDGMMVFFGAPESCGDGEDALCCVRMAWEMQQKMRELGEAWKRKGIPRPLQIRIGVNTGYAAVGSFGSPERLDYTAIGGEVNLASRLEAECEPGKVLVSFSTNALIQDEFETRSRGEIKVKGIAYPVESFEVTARK